MPLYKRQPNKVKTRIIAGEEYFSISGAAQTLGVSATTLRRGLVSKYKFRHAKSGDGTSPIFIQADDVRVYVRVRDTEFVKRLEQNTRV